MSMNRMWACSPWPEGDVDDLIFAAVEGTGVSDR